MKIILMKINNNQINIPQVSLDHKLNICLFNFFGICNINLIITKQIIEIIKTYE